jgi:hypothetical protein
MAPATFMSRMQRPEKIAIVTGDPSQPDPTKQGKLVVANRRESDRQTDDGEEAAGRRLRFLRVRGH